MNFDLGQAHKSTNTLPFDLPLGDRFSLRSVFGSIGGTFPLGWKPEQTQMADWFRFVNQSMRGSLYSDRATFYLLSRTDTAGGDHSQNAALHQIRVGPGGGALSYSTYFSFYEAYIIPHGRIVSGTTVPIYNPKLMGQSVFLKPPQG